MAAIRDFENCVSGCAQTLQGWNAQNGSHSKLSLRLSCFQALTAKAPTNGVFAHTPMIATSYQLSSLMHNIAIAVRIIQT